MNAMKFLKDLSSRANIFGISKDVGKPRLTEAMPPVNTTRSEAQKLNSDVVKHHVEFYYIAIGSTGCGLFTKSLWRQIVLSHAAIRYRPGLDRRTHQNCYVARIGIHLIEKTIDPQWNGSNRLRH
jgi:hypothetical protein